MEMTRRLTAVAVACFAMTGVSAAAELAPDSGYSVRLDRFEGAVYYTEGQDGYRVVATLASGAEEQPIRFISTLAPGQRMVISVPQSVDQPSIDFEIVRDGDVMLVSEPISAVATDLREMFPIPAALGK
jgi:hypothetical protein